MGIVPRSRALQEARDDGMDLVLIAPDAKPPVVKILDYNKHLFERKKQIAANKKKQKVTHVKEVGFRPTTREADYNMKIRMISRFLSSGDKAKIRMKFKGREVLHPEIGLQMLERVESDLSELASVEMKPSAEGKDMLMILAPHSKKGKAPTKNAKA